MKRLLLVDLSAVFWRNWHATKDAELGSAFESTIKKVRWLASSGYDGVGVCCDAPPYWRKELSAAYKSQRDAPDPAAVDQLRRVMERLSADGFPLWKSQGFEADDVIAAAALWASNEGHAVHVASADKDLLALVSEHVQLRNTSTDEIFDVAKVVEKFGVKPWQIPSYLALIGDSSDNVAGVAGVGPVKARELVNAYESVPQLLAALRANVVVGKPAVHAALKAAQSDGSLDLALKLVTLDTNVDGIDWSAAFKPREEKPLDNTPVTSENLDAEPPDETQELPPFPPQREQETQVAPATSMATVMPRNHAPIPYVQQLEPRSLGAALDLARMAVNSRSFGIANVETACAMILRGRALGLDAITSLSAFHVIKGKMCLTATMIEGMVMASSACEYFVCIESTAEISTWVTKRRGYPKEINHTWKIADAGQLGLLSLDQWKKQPRTMLRHRCGTDFARMVYPEVVAGIYATEEMSDE